MKSFLYVLGLSLLALPAAASFPEWCAEAYEAGDIVTAERMAKSLIGQTRGYNREDAVAGIECLTRFTGEAYTYHPQSRRFLSPSDREEQAEKDRMEAEEREAAMEAEAEQNRLLEDLRDKAEAAQAGRREAVASRLQEACTNLYARQPDETITNKVCLDVFWEIGLPD